MKAEYMEHMGSDLSVVNAARVSMDKQSDWEKVYHLTNTNNDRLIRELSKADIKLISFLARHNHWTPFAHPQITLRMGAPVPIRTQCFKHKQGFVENEESRRYIKSTPEVYHPEVWRKAAASVKQGSADEAIAHSDTIKQQYAEFTYQAVVFYENLIASGVCPEQARFILPQGCMVNWMWTGSLAAFARFYRQRTDPHAQKEIQMLAEKVGDIIEPLFPVSWKALTQ